MARPIKERLAELTEDKGKLEKKIALLENRVRSAEQKARTRQSIVVGALMIELACSGPDEARRFLNTFEKRLTREQDKKTVAPLIEELKAIAAKKPETP